MKVIAHEGPDQDAVWYLVVETDRSRKSFTKLLLNDPEIAVTKIPSYFSFFVEDVFAEFEFQGVQFCVEIEPFARERFEIRPKIPGHRPEILKLKDRVELYDE